MTAFGEILDWSRTAPAWLRDALRRIVTASELSDDDFTDLVEICRTSHGLATRPVVPDFLSMQHLPVAPTSGAVGITSITHIGDVNALAPNETLPFAASGLTVIYGENGAGKSGFTRILRRACRARGGDEPILPNAFSGKAVGTPTAKIDYTVAGVHRSHTWKDDTPADAELSAISVFDTAAAQVYVEAKTEVRFRPFGLDVIDRAAAACLRVKRLLETELETLNENAVELPNLASTTTAGRLIDEITALTPHAEIDRLGTLSTAEQAELDSLMELLAVSKAEDPIERASDLRRRAGRFRRLLDELLDVGIALADVRVDNVVRAAAGAAAADDEVRRAIDAATRGLRLAGISTPAWRAMWDSAKTYAAVQGYPELPFPNVGDGAVCVLCQQELQAAARERMQCFADLVVGTASENARIKRLEADQAYRAIADLRPGERNEEALTELVVTSPQVASEVTEFLTSARDCQADIVAGIAVPRRCSTAIPAAAIETILAELESRAEAFARAADPAERARSELRVAELDARKALGEVLADVHAEIDRLARVNAYDLCLKDTDTRALTKLGVDLTKKYVTDALTTAFASELDAFGLATLELDLKPAGQRGQLFHKVQLKRGASAAVQKIASEGESRCIALAAFMAELSGAGHDSAIVFDDPVSSLGHRWRSSVAQRLVRAAKSRQVVVFTHELVFLAALLEEARSNDTPAQTCTLTRDGDYAGRVTIGLPWIALSTKKRISALRQRWDAADKAFRTGGPTTYDPLATSIYADLRRTWERAVEEVLLNNAVMRFRLGIETRRLKDIADITDDDLKAIDNGMTKASRWEGGHDQAGAVNEPLPSPSELKADLDSLETWVSTVTARRK